MVNTLDYSWNLVLHKSEDDVACLPNGQEDQVGLFEQVCEYCLYDGVGRPKAR